MVDVTKYPFKTMEVGASFLVPKDTVVSQSFRVYALHRAKKLGKKFSVRAEPEGLRCWRVS